MSGPEELLRHYLRQRREAGETELVLDDLSVEALIGLLTREDAAAPAVRTAAPARAASVAPAREAAPAGATAPGPTASELVQIGSLQELRDLALGCPRCRLSETRSHVVFGEGTEQAEVVVVGEAPGAEEDRTGRPFVGRAGKLLDLLLASIGLGREAVYICNVLKCRPPANRDPQPDEIAACSPYLLRQLELVQPQAVLAVGSFAAQTLLGTTTSIGRLRGAAHEYHGIPLVPTYHPAALLRNPSWIRPVWEDLQRLRAILDRA